ncbi:hypothetical protein CBL_02969 [Carabus blaptoides fortunei]
MWSFEVSIFLRMSDWASDMIPTHRSFRCIRTIQFDLTSNLHKGTGQCKVGFASRYRVTTPSATSHQTRRPAYMDTPISMFTGPVVSPVAKVALKEFGTVTVVAERHEQSSEGVCDDETVSPTEATEKASDMDAETMLASSEQVRSPLQTACAMEKTSTQEQSPQQTPAMKKVSNCDVDKNTASSEQVPSSSQTRNVSTTSEAQPWTEKRKNMWNNVCNDLVSQNIEVTPLLCSKKWQNLVRTYKACKDIKNKSGRGPVRFQFFDALDNLLGSKPNFASPHSVDVRNIPTTTVKNVVDIPATVDTGAKKKTEEFSEKQVTKRKCSFRKEFLQMK